MKKNNLTELVIAGLVGAVIVLLFGSASPNLGWSGSSRNIFSEGVTNSTTTVTSASSTTILARNVNRQYASICNGSTTANAAVYLMFHASTTSGVESEKGYRLDSKACYEIDSTNLYLGRVMGRHDSAGGIIIYTLEK